MILLGEAIMYNTTGKNIYIQQLESNGKRFGFDYTSKPRLEARLDECRIVDSEKKPIDRNLYSDIAKDIKKRILNDFEDMQSKEVDDFQIRSFLEKGNQLLSVFGQETIKYLYLDKSTYKSESGDDFTKYEFTMDGDTFQAKEGKLFYKTINDDNKESLEEIESDLAEMYIDDFKDKALKDVALIKVLGGEDYREKSNIFLNKFNDVLIALGKNKLKHVYIGKVKVKDGGNIYTLDLDTNKGIIGCENYEDIFFNKGQEIIDPASFKVVASELEKKVLSDIGLLRITNPLQLKTDGRKMVDKANDFLKLLNLSGAKIKVNYEDADTLVPKSERDDIKNTFRDYKNSPMNGVHKKLLNNKGFEVKKKGDGHWGVHKDGRYVGTISSTPSAQNVGVNIAGDIINWILEDRENNTE